MQCVVAHLYCMPAVTHRVFALPHFCGVRTQLTLLGGVLSPNHLRLTMSYPLIHLRLCPTLGAVFMAATALILAAACASTRCSSTLCGLTLPPLQQQQQLCRKQSNHQSCQR